ncbi:MAG: 6-phosphogluconolactonase [Culicoidibacterales bacterium]
MKIIIKEDYETMSRCAALNFISCMGKPGKVNIAPTAGTTPKRMYEIIAETINGDGNIFENDVHYYQQDNFLSTKYPNTASYFKEIDEMFFRPNGIKEAQIERLTFEKYPRIHESIQEQGGLDLVIMGIGIDGHIAANMPNTPFSNNGYIVTPNKEQQKILAQQFNAPDADCWSSLGMATLMQAKKLILLVSGRAKAAILKEALEGPITEHVQASILRVHPNLTIICDRDAASLLSKK